MKTYLKTLAGVVMLAFGAATASAAHHEDASDHKSEIAPSTVIHVVTVSWKDDATEEDIQAALDGVKTLAEESDGIKRVWTETIKAQGNRSHAFVMEFKDEQALKDYAGSDAQEKWYKAYLPVREGSTTFDITN